MEWPFLLSGSGSTCDGDSPQHLFGGGGGGPLRRPRQGDSPQNLFALRKGDSPQHLFGGGGWRPAPPASPGGQPPKSVRPSKGRQPVKRGRSTLGFWLTGQEPMHGRPPEIPGVLGALPASTLVGRDTISLIASEVGPCSGGSRAAAVERLCSAGAPADGQTEPSAASRRLRAAPCRRRGRMLLRRSSCGYKTLPASAKVAASAGPRPQI
jgi:hypothetical protein